MVKKQTDESFASLFEGTAGVGGVISRKRLREGDEVEGLVVKVTPAAVFVELDGKSEAFIDRVDLAGPSKEPVSLSPGSVVRARVAEIGEKSGAVRLTPLAVRHENSDPNAGFDVVASPDVAIVVGARVQTTVTRIEAYGVFAQIEGTSGREGRGLIPVAETGLRKGTDLRKHFTVGQPIEAKIVSVDQEGKIRLSIRAVHADQERDQVREYTEKQDSGGATMGTLGDVFARARSGGRQKK